MADPFGVSNFTDGTVGGDGTFDKMMVAARAHLILEHDAGRITGDKFAEVYLGTMQSVLQTANQFTLMETKIEHENENLIKQGELLDAQILMLEAQVLNVPKQGILLDTQEEQATEQVLTQVEQTKLMSEQIDILQKQKGFGTMG